MSITKWLNRTEQESLYSAANSAIWHSHQFANSHSKRAAREEDYVATLVTNGVPMFASRWDSILAPKGIALKVSGVFCHGHPQVAFGVPQRKVELADLLVVHQHTSGTRTTARALLVQAKMSNYATHRLPSNDPQLELYSSWPDFKFVTGGLSNEVRNIKETGKGSRYALVLAGPAYPEQITWADQCPWAVSHANAQLEAAQSFAKVLGNLLLAKDGRLVQLGSPSDDWSRTIKELLEVTGQRTYRRANLGRGPTPRRSFVSSPGLMYCVESRHFTDSGNRHSGQSIGTRFFSISSQVESNGRGDGEHTTDVRDERGGGMSALIIETRTVERK